MRTCAPTGNRQFYKPIDRFSRLISMKQPGLSRARARQILTAARRTHVSVVGDAMLDHFIWGSVARISPEAPVPVVEFDRESFMPGGAANVARNLAALNT